MRAGKPRVVGLGGRGRWLGDSAFTENKMQDDSGAAIGWFQATDLQTLRPASGPLQCESRKRMTSEDRGALDRTWCPQSWLASSLRHNTHSPCGVWPGRWAAPGGGGFAGVGRA